MGNSYIKVSGVWQPIKNMYMKISGAWTPIKNAYMKVGGAWTNVFAQSRIPTIKSKVTISTNSSNYPATLTGTNYNWSDSVSDITSLTYVFQVSSDGTNFGAIGSPLTISNPAQGSSTSVQYALQTTDFLSTYPNSSYFNFVVTATAKDQQTGVSVSDSVQVTPPQGPGQITDLSASDVGMNRPWNNGAIQVSWSAPPSNGNAIDYYLVEYQPYGSSSWYQAGTTKSTSYLWTGLTAGFQYYMRATAHNGGGLATPSGASNLITVTTVPNSPTAISADSNLDKQTNVYFATVPDGQNGGYPISYYTATAPASLYQVVAVSKTGQTSPINLTGLGNNGYQLSAYVTATNANGTSANSSSVYFTPQAPYHNPITITTTTPVGTSDGFKFSITNSNYSSYSWLFTFTGGTTSGPGPFYSYGQYSGPTYNPSTGYYDVVVTNVVAGGYATLKIDAYDPGYGSLEGEVSVTGYTKPGPATFIPHYGTGIGSTTSTSQGYMTISSVGATSINYWVYYGSHGTGVTGYGTDISYTAMDSGTITGSSGTYYFPQNGYYIVQAQGLNDYGGVGTRVASDVSNRNWFWGPIYQAPTAGAPTLISATPNSTSSTQASLTISYTAGSNASSYNAYINGVLDGNTSGTTYTFSGLVPNQTVSWRIVSVNSAGTEGGSISGSATTPPFVQITAGPPTNVQLSFDGVSTVTLTWTAGTNATGYSVYINSFSSPDGATSTTSYVYTGAYAGETLTWKIVSGYNGQAGGSASGTYIVTTGGGTFTFAPFSFTPFSFTPFSFTPFSFTPFAFTPFGFTPHFSFTPFAFTPFGFTPHFSFTPFGFTPFGFTPHFSFTPFGFTPFGFTPHFSFTPFAFTYGSSLDLAISARTTEGVIPLSSIKLGDKVLTSNIDSYIDYDALSLWQDKNVEVYGNELVEVADIVNRKTDVVVIINDEYFTKEHLILINRDKIMSFVNSDNVAKGDYVWSYNNQSWTEVNKVQVIEDSSYDLISIKVEPNRPYYSNDILCYDSYVGEKNV